MRPPRALVTPLALLLLAVPALKAETDNAAPAFQGASYEACGLIASQYLTSLQLMEEGLAPKILKETLPGLSDAAAQRIDRLHEALSNQGATETYSQIHARFARCARSVHERRGAPEPGTRQDRFYRCAGENKIRYEITLAAFAGGRMKDVREQLAPRHKPIAEALFQRYEETDAATVLRDIATTFKACLRQPGKTETPDNG